MSTHARHYERMADALLWLVREHGRQPSLQEFADFMGLSPAHAQRTFQQWAGVTPKQYLSHLTREAALARLADGATVLDAALDSGLSGPGRLHDLLVNSVALTPGEARRRGDGLTFSYGSGPTPFGPALVAESERGLVFLGFYAERGEEQALRELRSSWPAAELQRDDSRAQATLQNVFAGSGDPPTRVWLHGSPFQLKVWEALLRIPEGHHVSYGDIAREIGRPQAARAVGAAVGRNPVAWLIPCHRVIGQLGALTGYRWGTDIKQAMMGLEASRAAALTGPRDRPADRPGLPAR